MEDGSPPGEHFCGSVLTHYGTFIRRLQSTVGSPRGMRPLRRPTGAWMRLLRQPTPETWSFFRSTSPARAALICGCPVREDRAVVFLQPPSEAQPPSSGRLVCVGKCAALFFKFCKTRACFFSRDRLYCE